jgi:hypothetical protein
MSMDQQLMQAMAAKKTGVAPEAQAPQPQQAPPQQPQQAAPQPKAPDVPTPPTDQEKASAQASPTTEGDMAQKEAVMYDINFGEQNRQLSDKQIKSTFDRYSSLNHKHQTMKPVLDFAEQLMGAAKEKGHEVSPDQFVKGLQRAFQKNAQFGKGTNTEKSPEGKVDTPYNNATLDDDALKRWEDENAVSLPPAYKESFAQLKSMQGDNAQLKALLKQLVSGQKDIAKGAKQGLETAATSQESSQKQRIINNLNQAQSSLGLPDQSDNDFFNFAYDRGYTIEDFMDPKLTLHVAQDFKNNMNTPEIERLREIAKRRQAFTGTVDSAPSAGGSSVSSNSDQSFIDTLANTAKAKQNMI